MGGSAQTEDVQPCLWRAPSRILGWWRFAWTAGDSPSSSPHTRLGRDEACRTQFALEREAESSVAALVRKGQTEVELEVEAFLPRAEYRYLTTLGKRVETQDGPPLPLSGAGRTPGMKRQRPFKSGWGSATFVADRCSTVHSGPGGRPVE